MILNSSQSMAYQIPCKGNGNDHYQIQYSLIEICAIDYTQCMLLIHLCLTTRVTRHSAQSLDTLHNCYNTTCITETCDHIYWQVHSLWYGIHDPNNCIQYND